MVVSGNYIYLELLKTGCTHVAKILEEVDGAIQKGKHHNLDDLSEYSSLVDKKVIFTNIRNPWDWYVSLWAYGCSGKGGHRKRMLKEFNPLRFEDIKRLYYNPQFFIHKSKIWKECYADSNNPDLFKRWLKLMTDNNIEDFEHRYKNYRASSIVGLYTYRYLKLAWLDFFKKYKILETYEQIVKMDMASNIIDYHLRTENLNDDLLRHADELSINRDRLLKYLNQQPKKTNMSERKSYRYYYDDESIAIVREKERFLIERFNYKF